LNEKIPEMSFGKNVEIQAPPVPCGIPHIEFRFDIDLNGIIHFFEKDWIWDWHAISIK
jgi:hypothetical protein